MQTHVFKAIVFWGPIAQKNNYLLESDYGIFTYIYHKNQPFMDR